MTRVASGTDLPVPRRLSRAGGGMRARDIMTSNPLVVTATDPVSNAAEIMRDAEIGIVPVVDDREARHLIGVIAAMAHGQVRRIPVVAEDNRLIGMISQADLATKVGPECPLDVERVLES